MKTNKKETEEMDGPLTTTGYPDWDDTQKERV